MLKFFSGNASGFIRSTPFSAGRLQAYNPTISRSLLIQQQSYLHITPFQHRAFGRVRTIARYTGYLALSSVFGILAVGAGIFINDAFTYSDKHVDRVPISPLALNPERGGPKNLPIVRVQVDDEQDEENIRLAGKPKLVILGGGWGVSLSAHDIPLLN
jgi:NADH dehydrogenase